MKKSRGQHKLLAVVLTAAMLVAMLAGCGANSKGQLAEATNVQIPEETQWVSKYGIPEEMRNIEAAIEREGIEGWEDVVEFVSHDFGEATGIYEFEDYIRIERYADGYAKFYVFPALTDQLSLDGDRSYSLLFVDAKDNIVGGVGYSKSNGSYGYANDELQTVMEKTEDFVVKYTKQYWEEYSEPITVEITEDTSNGEITVMTLTREATDIEEDPTEAMEEPTEEATEAPTEETEPAGPVLTTKVLDLAGCTLQDVSAVLGEYTEAFGFYWFDGGEVGYVYAYGTDRGNNYIQAPLNRLITNCPATLSVAQLQEYFPGGYTFYDEMDGKNCFAWDYRDCTVVIFENDDGTYTSDSLFYYNCDIWAQQTPQTPKVDASVNEEIFRILGKTETQIADILGSESGGYDYEYGCWVYPYQDTYVSVYMGDEGTCIGFNSTIQNVIKMSGSVDTAELQSLFGSTYNDPWNGETAYHTMYKGGRLCIYQGYGDEIGGFGEQSVVNFFQGDEVAFPDVEQTWTNSDSLFYGGLTVHDLSATQLTCSLEYYQLTPPNRSAMTDRITLTSTDGVNYTVSGVMDTWESTMNVTVKMLEGAAQVTFEYTKMGDLANFCFGDFVVYK